MPDHRAKPLGWDVISTGPEEVHLVPKADLIEHTENDECVCGPDVQYLEGGGKIITHASLDGRELTERKRKR